jgi:arginyl-tRNA synthetase
MWAILKDLGGEHPKKLDGIDPAQRSEWMAGCYVAGTQAYEEDEVAKQAIMALNRRIYEIHAEDDHTSEVAKIYWTCRQWSYDYFDAFYARLGVHFEKYYPESQTAGLGLETVRRELEAGVYSESDGAVVFEGEKYGLHTRVFVTSQGLPTYEAKDVGLIMAKWRDYHFDASVIITGNDIIEYMKVVVKSIEQFEPELAARTRHITHGNVKLAGGMKMSSRKGNFLRAVDVLDMASEANRANGRPDDERVVIGAIKYGFLKQRIGADMIFVPEDSVNLEGNSGPYLQYAHARARTILEKAHVAQDKPASFTELDGEERTLAFKIGEYPDVVERAVEELMPHHICTYLYELAQVFNRFYERSRVIGDPREAERLVLVRGYAEVLADGLGLLGLEAPAKL